MLIRYIGNCTTCRHSRQRLVWSLIVLGLFALAGLVGCSTAYVDHEGTVSRPLEQDETLTVFVLGKAGDLPKKAAKLEVRLSECVQQALNEAGRGAKLIPSDELRRDVFPDMDIPFARRSAEYLVSLLKEPQFQPKIDSLRLRYLITIEEQTTYVETGGENELMMLVKMEKKTYLKARIIDTKSASETGVVSTTIESKGYAGFGLLGIFYVPAVTESTACKRLGKEVVTFISSGTETKSVTEGR
jgi:hypothetical protein